MKLTTSLHARLAGIASAVWMFGCASPTPDRTRASLGPSDPPPPQPPLEVVLDALSTQVRRGEPARFLVKVRNTSESLVRIPTQPIVALVWTYPNGTRDNTLQPMPNQARFQESDLQTLNPGEELWVRREVSTRFFPVTGPTVFRAILHLPTNTNQSVGPIPAGRWRSNAFGISVID